MIDWRNLIEDVPDFPKPGIMFKDITPLLANGPGFRAAIDEFAVRWGSEHLTRIVAIESRGFVLGAPLAHHLGVGLTLIRKPGKLPKKTLSVEYALEYGTDSIELQVGDLHPGDHVLLIDDVLATGGTAAAARALVAKTGASLAGVAFLLELGFLNGRDRLPDATIQSLITV